MTVTIDVARKAKLAMEQEILTAVQFAVSKFERTTNMSPEHICVNLDGVYELGTVCAGRHVVTSVTADVSL